MQQARKDTKEAALQPNNKMKITKEKLLKIIQEEIRESLAEGLFDWFGGGDDEPEEPAAEEAPEEEEGEEDPGCQERGAIDFNKVFARVWKGRETRKWKEWPEAGGSPYKAVHSLLATLEKNPNMSLADAHEIGTLYRKYGNEFDFHNRFLEFQNSLRGEAGDVLRVTTTGAVPKVLPCMHKDRMVNLLSSLADGADRYSEPPKQAEREGDWAYGKGSHRISRLEEAIRREIMDVLGKEK